MSPKNGRLKIQVGAAVNPNKSIYIVRPTDEELPSLLVRGEYCNVLCSRQMGKTSLLHRTRGRLLREKIHSALIDVAGSLGISTSPDDWYLGLLQMVAGELKLSTNVRQWWRASRDATANQRLIQFFREEVLGRLDGRVVIFLDEIDSTLRLPFTDDLFVAIRWMDSERVRDPVYERLGFCLVGVATPNELIKDRRTTPYNVGRTIELRDFDPVRDDLGPLELAVSEDPQVGKAVVGAVLHWTGGHPYLTARLCDEFVRKGGRSPEDLERLVQEEYSSLRMLERDIHFETVLRFMQDRVEDRLATLQLYRRIRRGRREPDRVAPPQIALKLAGIVKRDDTGMLVVRNELYRRVFTGAWVRALLPRSDRRWLVGAIAGLLLGSLAWGAQYVTHRIETLENALDDYVVARSAYRSLARVPLFGDRANELWAELWERRAQRAEVAEDRDQALLYRLEARAARPTPDRARHVRDLAPGDEAQLLTTLHTESSSSIGAFAVFSPDGSKVLSGANAKHARLWSALDGQPVGDVMSHSDRVRAAAFSRDGSKVITGGDDGTAQRWSAADGSPIGSALKHGAPVRSIAFSPDGSKIVTGGDDGFARFWSAADGSLLWQSTKHSGPVLAVAFGSDGSRLLTSSLDNTVQLWSTADGALAGQLQHATGTVLTVVLSPDGSEVLTGSLDGTARLWSSTDGRPIGRPMTHQGPVRAAAFSPDGSKIVTGSTDTTARLWSTADQSALGRPLDHEGVVSTVTFSLDGTQVLTGGEIDPVRLWNVADGTAALLIKPLPPVLFASFSPDGSRILTNSSGGIARLWSLTRKPPANVAIRHDARVRAVAFNSDASKVVVGFGDGTARAWTTLGAPVGQVMKHDKAILDASFSQDDSKIITGSEDHTAYVWSAADGSRISPVMVHPGAVQAVAISPDGKKVMTAGQNGTVRLWQTDNANLLGEFMDHTGLHALAFSPNGTTAVASIDEYVRFWRVITGARGTNPNPPKPLAHSSLVSAFALNADDTEVLTGTDGGSVRRWSLGAAALTHKEAKHPGRVLAVSYSGDGLTIFTATAWWIHAFDASNLDHPVAGRLLPAPFKAFQPKDAIGSRLSVAVSPTVDSVQVLDLELKPTNDEMPPDDPTQLLEEWQRRLGLRPTEAGTFEPIQ